MVKVSLDFVLVHMLRASGDKNLVTVKDLKEMGRRIEELDDSLASYFDHHETSALMEDQPTRFSRPEIGSKYFREGYGDCGFVRSPGSDELFSDNNIWNFDFGAFDYGYREEISEEKARKLRREIVGLIEPGLLESGYNPFWNLDLGKKESRRIYAF